MAIYDGQHIKAVLDPRLCELATVVHWSGHVLKRPYADCRMSIAVAPARSTLFPPRRHCWRGAHGVGIDVKAAAGVERDEALAIQTELGCAARGGGEDSCQRNPRRHHSAVRLSRVRARH